MALAPSPLPPGEGWPKVLGGRLVPGVILGGADTSQHDRFWEERKRARVCCSAVLYGIAANTTAIDMFQSYSVEQGLTREKQSWDISRDILFPERTMPAKELPER